jgi:hypothetical protein
VKYRGSDSSEHKYVKRPKKKIYLNLQTVIQDDNLSKFTEFSAEIFGIVIPLSKYLNSTPRKSQVTFASMGMCSKLRLLSAIQGGHKLQDQK